MSIFQHREQFVEEINFGDRFVLLQGFGCTAQDFGGTGWQPTGGEIVTIDHLYDVEYFANGSMSQMAWVKFENGKKMCTWMGFLVPYKPLNAYKVFVPLLFGSKRKIQVDDEP